MYKKSLVIIIFILIFTLTIGCLNKKPNSESDTEEHTYYQTPPFKYETISEGVLITFDDIPDDVNSINIAIENCGEKVYTFTEGDYPNRRDMISYSMAWIQEDILEQVKQTKRIIFPFVKAGEKYNIAVVFMKSGEEESAFAPFVQFTAENGIYLEKDIELILNEAKTSVHLSDEPRFTSDVEYSDNTHSFSFSMFRDEHSVGMGGISTAPNTREIFWDFEPSISEQIKRSRNREPEKFFSGEYTAYIQFSIVLIYDNIEWYNYFVKSPYFAYYLE